MRFIEEVERVSGVQVSLISTNFSWRNVIDWPSIHRHGLMSTTASHLMHDGRF
jgi:hypothetical protein